MQIVDSHVHYWELSKLYYPWLNDLPMINHTVMPDSIPQHGGDWTVEKIVFIQADCIPEQGILEAEWVMSLASYDPRIRGIVAFAPLEKPIEEVRAWLERLKTLPMVRGVRRLIQSEPLGFATTPAFIESVQALAAYDYSFDLCVEEYQLADVLTLVAACPSVQFVMDHLGKPDVANKHIDTWREQITALAAMPNVICKLSGIITEADPLNWSPPDLQPYIDHVVAVFGADRLMFGSDSPVFRLAGTTYAAWIDIARASVKSMSDTDQQKVFYDNAARFYRV